MKERNDKKIYRVLNDFFHAYLVERDIEKTLSFVTDDIYSLGTGVKETAVNKKEFEELLRLEISAIPDPIRYEITDYHEKQTGENCWQCFCNMETTAGNPCGGTGCYMTRLTAAFCKSGDRYLATSLHMSEPSYVQEPEEFFPFRFISKQAEQMVQPVQRELLDMLCRLMPGGIIGGYIEEGFPLYVVNDKMLEMMGYTYEEFVEATDGKVLNSIYEEDVERVRTEVFGRMEDEKEYAIEYRVKKKDNGYLWVYDVGRKITADDGRKAIISILIDITGDVKTRMKLIEESEKDFLTGVYNRKGGEAMVGQKLRIPMTYIFLMLDLDNFKLINDIYGHEKGDQMLRYVGELLRKTFRQTDIVIRVGGDEFAVLIYPCTDKEAILKKVQQILRKYREKAREAYPESRTSISIGGIYGSKTRSFTDLYRLADDVLYEIKNSRKGQCVIREDL